MLVKLDTVINNIKGEPFKEPPKPGEDPASAPDTTLRYFLVECLGATLKGDENASGAKKVRLFNLGSQIQNAGAELDINEDDRKLLKDRIATMYGPYVVGPVQALLKDPKPAPAAAATPAE